MKTKEFMFEAKKPKIRMPKQRDPNWKTMQAKSTSGAGGAHKDLKKAEKQGDVKHKKDLVPMESIKEGWGDVSFKVGDWTYEAEEMPEEDVVKIWHDAISPDGKRHHIDFSPYDTMDKETFKLWIKLGMPKRQGSGPLNKEDIIKMAQIKGVADLDRDMARAGMKKGVKESQNPDEGYMDRVISDLHKDARGFRPDQEWGNWWMSLRYEEKVKVFNDMVDELGESVKKEDSDFGEPKEILADVLDTLEREVEWPLTEVMDYEEVLRLLAPIKNAVNQRLKTMDKDVSEAGDDWGSMSHREFKRRELQHELGHEDDPDFERKMMQKQMDRDKGPWYIRIDGKIYKQKGEPKVFDWKRAANNYALAILKNKPELQGKILLSKNSEDQ